MKRPPVYQLRFFPVLFFAVLVGLLNSNFLLSFPVQETEAAAGEVEQEQETETDEEPSGGEGEEADDENPFGSGPIDDIKPHLNEIVRLAIAGGRLVAQNDWELQEKRRMVDVDKDELLKMEVARLIAERGLPEEWAMREARSTLGVGENSHVLLNITRRFARECRALNAGGGMSGGNGQFKFHWGGESQEMEMDVRGDVFKLTNEENTGNRRSFSIYTDDDGLINFRFISDDLMLDFRQTNDVTKLGVIDGDDAIVYRAENYEQLLEMEPDSARKWLIPLMKKFGLVQPLSFRKFAVRKKAFEKLTATENDEQTVITLIDQLESDSFRLRNEATDQLRKDFFKWEHHIRTLTEDREFEKESKERVRKIIDGGEGGWTEDYITFRDVLNNESTLVELLELSGENEDRGVVIRRLEKISGQEIGDDVDLWKEWINR